MKLRIAHIDNEQRMAGMFVVQHRVWGVWYDMYFSPLGKALRTTMELGEGEIRKASFDDFHEAMKYAKAFKCWGKIIIRETWRV